MVVLGRITAPYGIRGWVRIHPFGDDPLVWCQMPRWWLGTEGPQPHWVTFDLQDCRGQGSALVARFEGVADRDAAEKLKGLLVGAPREALPQTREDEFYWADLMGLAVVNDEGEHLGRVADLISTGAHEVLCVRDETGGERLLPFVDAVVRKVDRTGGLIRVAWPRDW